MKGKSIAARETLKLGCGMLIGDALMCAVFALLGAFDYTVVLGALLGTAGSLLNFYLLGVTMQKTMNRESGQKKAVQLSYTLRMLMMIAVCIVGYLLPWFQTFAVIIPYLFATPVILILQAIEKKQSAK